MAVIQTAYGPKPTLTLAGGTPTTLATPSVGLGTFGGRGVTMSGGLTVSHAKIYRTQPWVAATINVLVRQLARLPWKTYQYLDASQDARARVRDHGLSELLTRPRPRRRGLHLRVEIAMSLWVQGTWVGWKRRPAPGAPPTELWTLDWRHLTPRGAGGVVEIWEWSGLGVPGCPRYIDPADIVVICWGSPEGEVGVSPLEQLSTTVRSEDSLQRYAEASMRNGTRFGMAAILDKTVNADKVVRDGLRDELEDVHGGVDRAFRPAILGGGIVDLKPLGEQSAVEAELIDQRKVNREEMAAVIGVPQPLAGILDHATYSNVQELHRILYVTTMGAHVAMIAESIQAQLVDDEPAWRDDGVFVEFDMGEVLKGDLLQRYQAYALAIQNGHLTLNDVRRLENQAPYTDPAADQPLIAANNFRTLAQMAAGTGDGGDGSKSVVDVIAAAVRDQLDAAQTQVRAGQHPADAYDPDAASSTLAAQLRAAGMNGTSDTIARGIVDGIAHDLIDVRSVDDVVTIRSRYLKELAPA